MAKGYVPQGADEGFKTVCVIRYEHPEFRDHPVMRGKSEFFHFTNWQEANRKLPWINKESENRLEKKV